jgi:Lrp/AsnC family transcriptional regulator, leucine-responsive regulatory protein
MSSVTGALAHVCGPIHQGNPMDSCTPGYSATPMAPRAHADGTEDAILALLAENARLSLTEIGRRVNLSPAAVNRRMKRLEKTGVIRGYTALLDPTTHGGGLDALVELHFAGTTKVSDIGDLGKEIDEVRAAFTIAGDPDALVWVRVSDMEHLTRTIDQLRRNHDVTGTKTLMVLKSWHRAESAAP